MLITPPFYESGVLQFNSRVQKNLLIRSKICSTNFAPKDSYSYTCTRVSYSALIKLGPEKDMQSFCGGLILVIYRSLIQKGFNAKVSPLQPLAVCSPVLVAHCTHGLPSAQRSKLRYIFHPSHADIDSGSHPSQQSEMQVENSVT